MSDIIKDRTNNSSVDANRYSESKGTGVLSSLVFMVVAIILMIVIANFVN